MSLCLEKLLSTQEEQWESFLRKSVEASEVSEVSFSEALQRRMEGAVLSLKSGSYTQRIQVKFNS